MLQSVDIHNYFAYIYVAIAHVFPCKHEQKLDAARIARTSDTKRIQNKCACLHCQCRVCRVSTTIYLPTLYSQLYFCHVSFSTFFSFFSSLISYAWCICNIRKNKHLAFGRHIHGIGMYVPFLQPKLKIVLFSYFVIYLSEVETKCIYNIKFDKLEMRMIGKCFGKYILKSDKFYNYDRLCFISYYYINSIKICPQHTSKLPISHLWLVFIVRATSSHWPMSFQFRMCSSGFFK